jgi:hypothetical protein
MPEYYELIACCIHCENNECCTWAEYCDGQCEQCDGSGLDMESICDHSCARRRLVIGAERNEHVI